MLAAGCGLVSRSEFIIAFAIGLMIVWMFSNMIEHAFSVRARLRAELPTGEIHGGKRS